MRELYSFFGQKGSVQSVSYHYGPLILFEVKLAFFERREQVGFFPVIHGTVGFEVIATLKVIKISNIRKMIALCLKNCTQCALCAPYLSKNEYKNFNPAA